MTRPSTRAASARAACVVAAVVLAACATGDPAKGPDAKASTARADGLVPVYVNGSIVHRERSALPPDAEVVVRLVDDTARPEKVVAETRIATAGRQVPIPFSLEVAPEVMNPDEPYLLRAQILVGGKVRYVTGARVSIRPLLAPASTTLLVIPGEQERTYTEAEAPPRGGARPPPPNRPGRRPPSTAPAPAQ